MLTRYPEVEKAVDFLVAKKWSGNSVTFTQEEIISQIQQNNPDLTRDQIFSRCLLDFEPAYRNAGWLVEYYKPAYFENYTPTFTFRKR